MADQLETAPAPIEDAGAAQNTDINTSLQDEMYPNEARTDANEGDDTQDGGDEQNTLEGAEGEDGADGDQDAKIDPPHSWNAEDRKAWDGLTAEAKQTVIRRESERDSYVRQKAAEAQQARQTVEREAAQAVFQVQQAHIAQLDALMGPLPPRPDPRLLQTGQEDHRALFYQQEAEFRSAVDQRQMVHQQAEQARQQAAQLEQHQTLAQRQHDEAVLTEKLGPEWTDPAKRTNLLKDLEAIGGALGYSAELMAQANATDILALKAAHEKFAKADKWDALQKAKMTDVRASKGQPPKMLQPGVAGSKQGNAQPSTAAILYPNDVRR